jgi:hypothetical protein
MCDDLSPSHFAKSREYVVVPLETSSMKAEDRNMYELETICCKGTHSRKEWHTKATTPIACFGGPRGKCLILKSESHIGDEKESNKLTKSIRERATLEMRRNSFRD